jgi:hypothetical protein
MVRVTPSSKAKYMGQTLSSARLPVYEEKLVEGSGCEGSWLRVQHGGWVCASFTREAPPGGEEQETHLENRYPGQPAQVTKDTPVYNLPGGRQTGEKKSGAKIEEVTRVAFFEGKHYAQIGGAAFVAADDLKFLGRSGINTALRGAAFDEETTFPFLFFVAESTPLYDAPGLKDPKKATGHKVRYDRESALAKVELGEDVFFRVEGGWLLKQKGVLEINPEPVPAGIPAGSRWALADLSDQLVVAYEGDRPAFATLTSSGKAGKEGAFWTVSGSYRIQSKYRYKDMEGSPFGDYYLVEGVPWPQYFFEGYAFHGAFWHNSFGRVASHGCLNLSPADAKWMSDFLHPSLPPGWMLVIPPLEMETSVVVVRQ